MDVFRCCGTRGHLEAQWEVLVLQGAPQEAEDQAEGPEHAADPFARPTPSVSARLRDAAANVADQVCYASSWNKPAGLTYTAACLRLLAYSLQSSAFSWQRPADYCSHDLYCGDVYLAPAL